MPRCCPCGAGQVCHAEGSHEGNYYAGLRRPVKDRSCRVLVGIFEAFCANGEAAEQPAGRILSDVPSNLRLVLVDRAHACHRILSRAWDKDDYMKSSAGAALLEKGPLM